MLTWYRGNGNLMCVLSRSVVSDSLDTMDCCLPGSSVHGNFQARILEWVSISSAGDLSNPGIEPRTPACIAGGFFFFFLLSESPWKPKSAGMDSLSLLQVIFLTQELIQVSYIAGRFFTSWAIWEGPRNLRHGLIILLLNHCKESMLPKVIN